MLLYLLKTKGPDIFSNIGIKPLINNMCLDILKNIINLYPDEIIDERNIKRYIGAACNEGQINIIKWLIAINNTKYYYRLNYENLFYDACINGHSEMAKYLASLDKNVMTADNIKYVFCRVCEYGKFDIAKWFYSMYQIDIHQFNDYAFRWSCINGHKDISEWLYSLSNGTISNDNMYDAFVNSCTGNHLELAKWLFEINDYILDHFGEDALFSRTCVFGNLDIVHFLINTSKDHNIYNKLIDTIDSFDYIFRRICGNGFLQMAKWFDVFSLNYASLNYDRAFIESCENGHIDISEWLFDTYFYNNPFSLDKAFIQACGNGKLDIINWLINLEEFNFNDENPRIFEEAYIKAINKHHYDVAKWLYEKENRINLHINNELAFRKACDDTGHNYENNSYEFVKWLDVADANKPINYKVLKHIGFINACKNNNIGIASWLVDKCDNYHISITNNKIEDYRINNEIHKALEIIKNDYTAALNILNIPSFIIDNLDELDVFCVICKEYNGHIIMTSCGHYYCLECLLQWFTAIDIKEDFSCAYCRKIFNWNECKHLINN